MHVNCIAFSLPEIYHLTFRYAMKKFFTPFKFSFFVLLFLSAFHQSEAACPDLEIIGTSEVCQSSLNNTGNEYNYAINYTAANCLKWELPVAISQRWRVFRFTSL